jgi:hypothetical protein
MPSTPKRRQIRCERAMITPVHSIQQGNPTTAPNIVYLCPSSYAENEIGCNASILAIPSLPTRCADENLLHTSFDDLSLNSGGFESIGEQPNRRRRRSVHFESMASPLSSSENTSRRSVASSLNGFYSPSRKGKENFPFISLNAPLVSHLCLPKLHVSATSSRHNLGVKNLKRRAPPSSSEYHCY